MPAGDGGRLGLATPAGPGAGMADVCSPGSWLSFEADLVGQRVATLFRLQELLTGIGPALDRAVELNRMGPMMVLAC